MPHTFRCKCDRWLRTRPDDQLTRCPKCLRTVQPHVGFVWWSLGSVAAVLAVVVIVVAVLPRSSTPVAGVQKPTPPPTTSSTPAKKSPPTEPSGRRAPATQSTVPAPPPMPAAPLPAPAPLPDLPRVGKLVVEPAGRYKEGDTFVQTVTVSRTSAFGVLGIATTQAAEYTLTAKLEVNKVNADGSITVTQTVLSGKLLDATPDMKEPLADALKKAVGAKFELTVAQNGKVLGLKGLDDPLNIKLGRNVEQQSLRFWSVLDADAWRELSGFTFFQPDKPGLGEKWNRDFTHDWGPLGSWLGRTDYRTAAKAEKDGRHKVDYTHVISHRPAKAAVNQPFTVRTSAFPGVTANGTLRYDAATNRVSAAEEVFHVRGGVVVSFGGADATVEVEEVQKFRLTASVVKPHEMTGQKPKQ